MELGKTMTLPVVTVSEFGVYLGSADDKVLLPNKEVPQGANVGDEIEVFILRDSQDRIIATREKPIVELGQTAVLKVNEVTKYGAFLDWGLGKDLFLPYKEQTVKVQDGDKVLIGVYTDKSNRLCATMKVYSYLLCSANYKEDDIVTGTVYNYNPQYGAFVAVDNKYHGLIQQKELTNKVFIGMPVSARVKSVRPDGKLDLSFRKKAYMQIDDDAEEILRFLNENEGKIDYTDKASPETIKNDFNMSKSEFKRAIGRLLKEGYIKIGENSIFLIK